MSRTSEVKKKRIANLRKGNAVNPRHPRQLRNHSSKNSLKKVDSF